MSTVPNVQELVASTAWQTVEFISDLHLQASEPLTFAAWQQYLATTKADAVFILGDLFEVWVGDDAAAEPGFEADCLKVLRTAAQHTALYFMCGNRDFLISDQIMRSCGVTLLEDPTALTFHGKRWLLSHGDALCLDDIDYQKFRQQVRNPQWQQAFLAQPLNVRQNIARQVRTQSEARHQTGGPYADLDDQATRDWLRNANAQTMIHGHTHRPAQHALSEGFERVVLSDWDLAASSPRAEVLQLTSSGLRRIPWAQWA
ncbi:UDP-2,3-diacylglucosamine diphosphatase [Variovorax sp. HJSM1_2]|uniref:UDP-2,3-diacylglucosamine diphosphatase n=1 Tax=Variovorax sp. HJSM1_2 TaxID=3366263 RepID=UPI003BE17515